MAVLLVILQEGLARFDWALISEQPSRLRPEGSGVQSAIFGTLWVMFGTILLALPIGIAGAIYLEEYADNDKWWNRLIELNIQNLVAVPSIIYGILTLAFVVRGPLGIGPVALAGSVALALLILPVIIITTREALRAVPQDIREASLALGATQWQTTWRQVLPSAVSGIATGTILALSRAIGEAAPLILVGATVFVTVNPDGFFDRYTVLPVQIFNLVKLPEAGEPEAGVGNDPAVDNHPAGDERPGDLVTQQIPADVGNTQRETRNMTEIEGEDDFSSRAATDTGARRAGQATARRTRTPQGTPTANAARVGRDHDHRESRRQLRRLPGGEQRQPGVRKARNHRVDRSVRLRQVDGAALLEPDERPHTGRQGARQGQLPRHRHLRPQRRCDQGSTARRDGLPEAQPISEVDLRQHRLRAPCHRHEARTTWTRSWSAH